MYLKTGSTAKRVVLFASNLNKKKPLPPKGSSTGRKLEINAKSITKAKVADKKRKSFLRENAGRIDQLLDPNFREEKMTSDIKKHLITVLDVRFFFAQQEIPLQGNDQTNDR